ncbi:hypothetical protein CDL15_Pgr010981 [Punica granatum]|uniref:Uncharacterized protein n=1 Tax=Punica granatum TaxID=22663 RepID=A0A218XMD4_PUNGR|nr:hypothetical protein CDL15_Pgr010981 [Punica granatum]
MQTTDDTEEQKRREQLLACSFSRGGVAVAIQLHFIVKNNEKLLHERKQSHFIVKNDKKLLHERKHQTDNQTFLKQKTC